MPGTYVRAFLSIAESSIELVLLYAWRILLEFLSDNSGYCENAYCCDDTDCHDDASYYI